jgi:hypothetical protein
MTRADRATFRPEFAARWTRLLERASSGRQALAAQGALALLWHEYSTASGFVPLTEREVAGVLDVDLRTWRALARLLVDAGLLETHAHGYAVPDPTALEGTSVAAGTAGFLRTHRPTYAELVQRAQRAGMLTHRRGTYVLAALGAFELLRVGRANWATGVARWSTAAAGREFGVTAKTWAGYLLLLERALLVERTGTRVRVLGWRALCWGPSWRRTAGSDMQRNPPDPVDDSEHNSPDLSASKARTEVTNSPQPPAVGPATTVAAPVRLRRGEHELLPELLTALENRVPAAAFARWRRPVRQQLSHALAAARGDVAALAVELTRRDLTTARDVPAALGYRCAGAVEVVRARQTSRAAADRLRAERAEQAVAAATAAQTAAAAESQAAHLLEVAGELWTSVLTRVAADLPWAVVPGAPGESPGRRRMLEAEARTRVLTRVADLAAADCGVNAPAGRTVHTAVIPASNDALIRRAVEELSVQNVADAPRSHETTASGR